MLAPRAFPGGGSGVAVFRKNPDVIRAARAAARRPSELQRARGRAIANRLKHYGAQAGLDPKLCMVAMQLLHQRLLTEQQVNAGIEIATIYGEYERAIGAPRRSEASPHYGEAYCKCGYGPSEILVEDERAIRARKRRDDLQVVFNDLPVGHKDRVQTTIEKLFVENQQISNAKLPSIRPVLDQAAVRLGFAPEPRSRSLRRTPKLKSVLVAVLRSDKLEDERLDAADRAFLTRWADNCADDPIWETVVGDARAKGLFPHDSLHSTMIWYAFQARRFAESVKAGEDPILREEQKRRAELLELAQKADDLARYYKESEKYSGIAMFFQQHLALPVLPEQEAVPRFEPPFLRVRQLRQLHEREAQLLRQSAGPAPKPTTFISRERSKRRITAFIHLMTDYMDEFCGKHHRRAVAMLASMAFNCLVDNEDVRKALGQSTREGRRHIRALKTKKN
jgi:hypothetical protein